MKEKFKKPSDSEIYNYLQECSDLDESTIKIINTYFNSLKSNSEILRDKLDILIEQV